MFEDESKTPDLIDLQDEILAQIILERFGFTDWKAALIVFLRMESRNQKGLAAIFPFFIKALGSSADPHRSLVNFERFIECCGPELFTELEENPRIIEILIT